MKPFVSFVCGLIFSCGLVISGMTIPENIINFLDITGNWDPSLMLVMVGAIGVHSIAQLIRVRRMSAPLMRRHFEIPSSTTIDSNLILGSVMFGAGWGLVGFCPAPAITSLASLDKSLLLFVVSLLVGMKAHATVQRVNDKKEALI